MSTAEMTGYRPSMEALNLLTVYSNFLLTEAVDQAQWLANAEKARLPLLQAITSETGCTEAEANRWIYLALAD